MSSAIVFSFDTYPMTDIIETKKYQTVVDDTEVEYTILNYNKNAIQDGDIINGKYRSVILATPTDNPNDDSRIVCYGIPKSVPLAQWKQIHSEEISPNKFLVNEIVEGTMMNLFYDERYHSWMIATKTTVGGNNYYFKLNYGDTTEPEKTFKEMFIEALGGNPKTDTLNSLQALKNFQKDFIYSFVLQHPFNHLVLNIIEPKVYLVAIYYVNDENKVQYISERDYNDWSCFADDCVIKFPKRVSISETTLEELLIANENNICENLGVMITHIETGDRYAIKNKNYEYLKQIRGNHPNFKYHYYELLKNNCVNEFLYYFPRYYYLFWNFYTEFMAFAQELHHKYIQYYVKKDETIIPKNFAILRNRLHREVYLPYKNTGVIIDKNRVIIFLMTLETKELYYYIVGYDKKMAMADED